MNSPKARLERSREQLRQHWRIERRAPPGAGIAPPARSSAPRAPVLAVALAGTGLLAVWCLWARRRHRAVALHAAGHNRPVPPLLSLQSAATLVSLLSGLAGWLRRRSPSWRRVGECK